MTQAQLAAKAGVGVSVVGAIECGRTSAPSAESLVRLADALGLDPEALLAPASVAEAQADSDQGSVNPETQHLPAVNGDSSSSGATEGSPRSKVA